MDLSVPQHHGGGRMPSTGAAVETDLERGQHVENTHTCASVWNTGT